MRRVPGGMPACLAAMLLCRCGGETRITSDPVEVVLDGGERALGVPLIGRSFQVVADATVEGPAGTFRTLIRSASDGRVRMEQTPSGFRAGVGSSGGWHVAPGSARVDSLGADLAFVRGHELHMLALAPRTRFEHPRLIGNTEFSGRPVVAVAMSLPTGDSLVAYFDAVDTVPVGARIMWTDPPVDVTWAEWSTRGAVRLFGQATFRQGTEEFRYTYDSVYVGEIQDSVYEPPTREK